MIILYKNNDSLYLIKPYDRWWHYFFLFFAYFLPHKAYQINPGKPIKTIYQNRFLLPGGFKPYLCFGLISFAISLVLPPIIFYNFKTFFPFCLFVIYLFLVLITFVIDNLVKPFSTDYMHALITQKLPITIVYFKKLIPTGYLSSVFRYLFFVFIVLFLINITLSLSTILLSIPILYSFLYYQYYILSFCSYIDKQNQLYKPIVMNENLQQDILLGISPGFYCKE